MNHGNNAHSIVPAVILVALLATFQLALAQTTEPILRVEAGAHNGIIYEIAMDPSNSILITGSEDKTARIWDISRGGKLLLTLHPPIGEGEEGQIYAVGLSPDGGTVAIGGQTGSVQQNDACLYLFDRTTGALTRRLGGLPSYAQHLTYTADGRFLAVVMSRSGMRLYRLPDYALVAEDRDYGDLAKWVVSDPTGALLATGCYDGFVRLYDLSVLRDQNPSSLRPISPVSRIRPPGGQRPYGIAFSPDGTRLAVAQNLSPKVDVLEVKGNVLQHVYSPDTKGVSSAIGTDLRALAWSSDGRFLYAGGQHVLKGIYYIRKWADGGRGGFSDLPTGAHLSFSHLLSLRSGGIVYCSRDGSFGILDDRDQTVRLSVNAIPMYVGNQKGFLISKDGAGIQFAYESYGKSPAVFTINERVLTDAASRFWTGLKANYTFQGPIIDGLGVSDWNHTISPKLKGKPLPLRNEMAESLAIKPDKSGFLLGTTLNLFLFDLEGKIQWKVRIPGMAWGLNTNGQVVVAALGDGTIRWYRLSDGKELLAFFPHNDRKRWVLWTPLGYYDASPGGEDFIGWHVNNGRDRAADFFPASRFRSTYYRPDVIDRVLTTMDEAVALRQANEEAGRNQVAAVSVRGKLPPVITILTPVDGTEVSTPSATIRYSARSQEAITGVKVLVDGRPVNVKGIVESAKESGEISVPIPSRDCEVSVIAENQFAVSEPATIRLRWKGFVAAKEEFQIKPKLYVLAVGVSQYQNAELRLGLAAKDARDFTLAWNDQKGRMYSGVEVRSYTDAQATKGNILDGLEWLQRQVTQKDVAVLFFAGHGVNDPNGLFYFLPVDADLERLKRTGIPQSDIISTVTTITGKVLVFMDACHSGNLMGNTKRRGVAVTSAVVNELASAENGAVVFSSSAGRQYSQENPEWGNGAFTKGVVEGIRGKADYRGAGHITVNMLDLYISERVKELTKGEQTPTTVKPPNVPDFPVAALR